MWRENMRNRSGFDSSRGLWRNPIFAILSPFTAFGRRTPVPPSERRDAIVLGLPNARFFLDEAAAMSAEQEQALFREAKSLGVSPGGILPTGQYLSLSGGGDKGAFGAGLLVGWTAHGDCPKFKLVTGVSTGALSAPFAFLGPEYDAALPPGLIDVEANGKSYQEMHVDGGAVSQAFLIPPSLIVRMAQERAGFRRESFVAYVIRNSRLRTEWSDVQRTTLPIAGKAVSIMLNYIGLGDLYHIYLAMQRAGADFNVAYIGDGFQAEHKEQFEQGYMRALYHYAYEKAARGYPWEHAPPGFQAEVR
jgi:hypothetical protein